MSVAESEGMVGCSDSFWEIGQYKRTVKRIDDGSKLCGELMSLIKERGEIEVQYAKQLKQWSKKWSEAVEKGPEYGSMASGWVGVTEEADKRCDMHSRVKDRLMEEVYNTVKMWHKDNYHTTLLKGIKESSEQEEAFRKAQKPWAKLYAKVDKTKKDYHTACKAEKTAIQQDKNAQNDSGVSQDQLKKLSEKVDRLRDEKEKARTAYENALQEINSLNARYMEDMTQVFEKCQEMELKRLKFFKEMLFGIHKCLDLSQDPKLGNIYKDCWSTIEGVDSRQDLKWWQQTHGTGMPMNWPSFEEYTEEFRVLNKGQKKKSRIPAGPPQEGPDGLSNGVTLISQKQSEPIQSTRTQQPPNSLPTSGLAQQNGNGHRHDALANGNLSNSSSDAKRGDRGASVETPTSPSPFDDFGDEEGRAVWRIRVRRGCP